MLGNVHWWGVWGVAKRTVVSTLRHTLQQLKKTKHGAIHTNMKRCEDLLLSEIQQVNQDTHAIHVL